MQLTSSTIRRKFITELYVEFEPSKFVWRKFKASNMAPSSSHSVAVITALYHNNIMKQRRRKLRQMSLLLYFKSRALILRTSLLCLLFLTRSLDELARKPRIRSCRRLKRNPGWWENVWQNYTSDRFKLTFRIPRETFNFILERIRPELERKTVVEDPISPECCLAICLYRLGRGDYPYTIAEMTGFGISTVREVITDVCEAIIEKMWKECVSTC